MNRLTLLLILGFTMPASTSWAGGAATLGKVVPASNRVAIEQIDHSVWNSLLNKYCDASGMVDYQTWKSSQQDQRLLDQYLSHLSLADPSKNSSSDSQLAFWINTYNAITVKGILREYPTSSIRNHTARVFGYNIWDDLLLPVGERTYSLNQIEHDVLRKMGEPRIHFAIVCASIGCPPLLNSAYLAEKIDLQLTANSKRFFADPKKFRYDVQKRTFQVSPILDWFSGDFGTNQAGQLKTIAPYLPDQSARDLAAQGQVSVSYLDYDWSLNDQAKRTASNP